MLRRAVRSSAGGRGEGGGPRRAGRQLLLLQRAAARPRRCTGCALASRARICARPCCDAIEPSHQPAATRPLVRPPGQGSALLDPLAPDEARRLGLCLDGLGHARRLRPETALREPAPGGPVGLAGPVVGLRCVRVGDREAPATPSWCGGRRGRRRLGEWWRVRPVAGCQRQRRESSDGSDIGRGRACRAESPTPWRVRRLASAAEAASGDDSDREARASDAGPDGDDDGGVGPTDGDDDGGTGSPDRHRGPSAPRVGAPLGLEAAGLRHAGRTDAAGGAVHPARSRGEVAPGWRTGAARGCSPGTWGPRRCWGSRCRSRAARPCRRRVARRLAASPARSGRPPGPGSGRGEAGRCDPRRRRGAPGPEHAHRRRRGGVVIRRGGGALPGVRAGGPRSRQGRGVGVTAAHAAVLASGPPRRTTRAIRSR